MDIHKSSVFRHQGLCLQLLAFPGIKAGLAPGPSLDGRPDGGSRGVGRSIRGQREGLCLVQEHRLLDEMLNRVPDSMR